MKLDKLLVLIFLLSPTLSFAQWDKVEIYSGVNFTKPTFSANFATSEARIGYTFGGLYTIKERPKSGVSYQLGLGFTRRVYNVNLDFSMPTEVPSGVFAKNLIQDIEIPFLVAYTWHFNEFQIKINTGLIPGFNIYYKSELNFINMPNNEGGRESYDEIRSVRPNAFKRMNVFTGISFIKPMRNFKVGIQPHLQYNFLPAIQENSLGPEFWTYGLNLTFSK